MKSLPSRIVKSPQVQLAGTVPIDNTVSVPCPAPQALPVSAKPPAKSVAPAASTERILRDDTEIDAFLNPFSSLWELGEDPQASPASPEEASESTTQALREAALEFRDRCRDMLILAFKARDRLLREAAAQAEEQNAKAQADSEAITKQAAQHADDMLRHAREEAQALLERTAAEARKTLDDATEQAVHVLKQAKLDGCKQGHLEGREQAKQECAGFLHSAKDLTDRIRAEKDALFRRYEQELSETALAIAEKILLHEIQQNSEFVRGILRQAARNYRGADHLTIRLSALDVSEELFSDLTFLQEIVGSTTHIEIQTADDVGSGTIVLDDGREILDASVSTQLQMIREIAEGRRAEAARSEEGAES